MAQDQDEVLAQGTGRLQSGADGCRTGAGALEPGAAAGSPIAETTTLRDAMGEMLWSGRTALPIVSSNGRPLGQITLAEIVRRAACRK